MDDSDRRASRLKNVLITLLLVAILLIAIFPHQSQTQETTEVNNRAALTDCINKNVVPLQNQTIIAPADIGQALAKSAQVALDGCKAQYSQ